jgi:hypothetical protein
MTDSTIEEAWQWAEANKHRYTVPKTLEQQREVFARNTGLALHAQAEILGMEIAPDDPHYRAKLQAKASVASQQITAALKADENRLKTFELERSFYMVLKIRLGRCSRTLQKKIHAWWPLISREIMAINWHGTTTDRDRDVLACSTMLLIVNADEPAISPLRAAR